MRYRKLTSSGDYSFGMGVNEFWVNTAAGVAQAIQTRLLLMTGEWFLDNTEGTPYATDILGKGTVPLYDQAIKERVLGTTGVVSIDQYVSYLSPSRDLSVGMLITTQYGQVIVNAGPENPFPPVPGILDVNFILDQSYLA